MALGWVHDHYLKPIVHFSYFGFSWVSPISVTFIYFLHAVMIAAAIGVILGYFYRLSALVLFLSFTYVELIDITYYLNHYYFVSMVLLLLIWAPAHHYFSLDANRGRVARRTHIPKFWIFQFQLFIGIVYTYAGLAKINSDWLLEALPMKIWLPAADTTPVLGALFSWPLAPYFFSWAAMLYDCSIVWWLSWSVSRPWAFISVILFHTLTGILFQIGVFPIVMVGAALIFFSEKWHCRLLDQLSRLFSMLKGHFPKGKTLQTAAADACKHSRPSLVPTSVLWLAVVFFSFQILFPLRHMLYPGDAFWTEQGYRFSWRVMLMEKAGTATFYVKDAASGREGLVVNSEFLNPHQEKQMAMQPDLILQYAHFLKDHYQKEGMVNPSVRAEVYVTLNARPSKLLIDPQTDLTQIEDGWRHKWWIEASPFDA